MAFYFSLWRSVSSTACCSPRRFWAWSAHSVAPAGIAAKPSGGGKVTGGNERPRMLLRALGDEARGAHSARYPTRLLWAVRNLRSARPHTALSRRGPLHRVVVRLALSTSRANAPRVPAGVFILDLGFGRRCSTYSMVGS